MRRSTRPFLTSLLVELKQPLAVLSALLMVMNLLAPSVLARSDDRWNANTICAGNISNQLEEPSDQSLATHDCKICCLSGSKYIFANDDRVQFHLERKNASALRINRWIAKPSRGTLQGNPRAPPVNGV